jgi:hypothetical protein
VTPNRTGSRWRKSGRSWQARSKLHLVCDGSGLPLTAAVTAANVPDVIVLTAMVDHIPPVRPRHLGGGRCQRPHPPDTIRASPVDLAGLRSQVRSGATPSGSASRPWAGPRHAPPFRAGRAEDLAGVGRPPPAAPGREVVADQRLPWERPRPRKQLSPLRVRRGFPRLLWAVSSPASTPNPCGRSPGRSKGRRAGSARRCPAVKKAA